MRPALDDLPGPGQAARAIAEIGTNAVPTLLRMLQHHDSKLRIAFTGLLQKLNITSTTIKIDTPNTLALRGFSALGARASNAVPKLIMILDSDPSPFSQTAVPVILGQIGPPAQRALPRLLQAISHSNQIVRINSIWAVSQIRDEPDLVLPVLIKCLEDRDPQIRICAVDALSSFGKDAQPAIPQLLKLWGKERLSPSIRNGNHTGTLVGSEWFSWPLTGMAITVSGFPDPDSATATGNALKAIDPETAAKAGVK